MKVPAKISGMADLLAQSTGQELELPGTWPPAAVPGCWPHLPGLHRRGSAGHRAGDAAVNRIRRKKRRRSRPGAAHGN